MKKTFLSVLLTLFLLSALPAMAQSPSPKLSPYEEQRYGSDLSQVPREPYRTESSLEGYKARPYIPPDAEPSIRPDSASRRRIDSFQAVPSRIGSRDPGLRSPQTRVRDRYQTRATWRNEQNKISERSRVQVPQPPLRPGNPNIMGTPAPGQPSFPSTNR